MKNVLKDFIHQLDVMNTLNGGTSTTSVNIDKKESEIVINIHAPSVSSDSFNIFIKGDQLVIYTIIKDVDSEYFTTEVEEKMASRHMAPMFSRIFDIPPFVNKDEIDAVFENGNLLVSLPFQQPDTIPVKRIDIKEY